MKDFAYRKTPQKFKNASDLQVRFRTGFIYVTVSVLCILASEWTTLALLSATAAVCAGEFFYMLRSDAKLPNEMLGIVAAALYPFSVHFFGLSGALVVVSCCCWRLSCGTCSGCARVSPMWASASLARRIAACCFPAWWWFATALPHPWGGVLVLGIFFSVWANDSFAYLVGSKFGKHKLAPRVSPKKSWEGFLRAWLGRRCSGACSRLSPG